MLDLFFGWKAVSAKSLRISTLLNRYPNEHVSPETTLLKLGDMLYRDSGLGNGYVIIKSKEISVESRMINVLMKNNNYEA